MGEISKQDQLEPDDVRKSIEETAISYNFEQFGWMGSDIYPEDNKVFLAMLDDVFKESKLQLPDENIVTVDFGCGHSPYLNGLANFLTKQGKDIAKPRHAEMVAWDANEDVPLPIIERDHFEVAGTTRLVENEKDVEKILKDFCEKYGKLDVVTFFDLGPSPGLYKSGGEYLSTPLKGLNPFIKDGGVVVLTTSFGGQKEGIVPSVLEENDFEVLVDEENKYRDYFKEFPHHHDHIIVARKKAKEK